MIPPLLLDPFRQEKDLSPLMEDFFLPSSLSSPSFLADAKKEENVLSTLKQLTISGKTREAWTLLTKIDKEAIPQEYLTPLVLTLWEVSTDSSFLSILFAWMEVNQYFPKIGKRELKVVEVGYPTIWLLFPQIGNKQILDWMDCYSVAFSEIANHWLRRIQHFRDSDLLPQLEVTLNRLLSFSPFSDTSEKGEKEECQKLFITLLEEIVDPESQQLIRSLLRQVQGFAPIPPWVQKNLNNYRDEVHELLSSPSPFPTVVGVPSPFLKEKERNKDRLFGPLNLLTMKTGCDPFGIGKGCRMLSCNCYLRQYRPSQDDIDEEEGEEEDDDFFTGECDYCMKKISDVSHVVRKISSRGWKGVYCSWNCITMEKTKKFKEVEGKVVRYHQCAKCRNDILPSLSSSPDGDEDKEGEEDKEVKEFVNTYKHLGKYQYFCSFECKQGYINQKVILMEIAAERLHQVGIWEFPSPSS